MEEDEREFLDVLQEAADYLMAQGKMEYGIAVRAIALRMEDPHPPLPLPKEPAA